ncbi:NEL domain-containing protein [Pseudomonas sp. SK]|uniref:NEL domain-containing protein n=1 Tax=Pseudomonas sp. SK TaxID=2729423 RepID=UPI0021153091|nr:NEL domain-containing protein [Pseudomonas sp. SK]
MPNPAISQPGVHYATIERKIPAWLKLAPPETHRAMRNWQQAPAWLPAAIQQQPDVATAWQEEHARHRGHQAQVDKLFERLPDLETYASATLTDAIKQRFGLDLDVRHTYLVDARLIDTANAIDSRQAIDRATRSLLHCALHNFDQAAAAEHGMDAPGALLEKSVILDHRRFMGTVPITNAVGITAEAFADLCRTLDIGGKYHEQVHAIYYPGGMPQADADAAALAVYETLGRAEVSAFRQSLHFARLKGDISETLYSAALAAPLDQATAADSTVTFSLLDLWEAELTGVVLITLQAADHQAVALYIPQDSTLPLKEFTSQQALLAELGDRLQADIHYLDKHIGDRDKPSVIARLKDRLTPLGWSTRGIREPVADLHAALYPVAKPFSHAFQGVMAFQKTQRHEQDVLFHAIPTEIVDRRTAQAHRELIAGRVLTALNIAGFFVPGLGEAMLAVCVTQLAFEVYDGIEAWENDERDIAYGYLVDVVENVALMAALSAAAKALRGAQGGEAGAVVEGQEPVASDDEEAEIERIPVETPSFIEELEDVETADGQVRLWKPDLAPYQSSERLPEGLEADAFGLRQHDGRHWLVVQGDQYIVEQAAASGEYRLQHPQNPRRYQPPVRHNGAGAWLLETDRPLSWSGMQLLRRIGHLNAHFDETTLQRIVALSGCDEEQLRRALAANQRLPALLEDTLQRFKLDDSLRLLPDSSTRPAEFHRAYSTLPITLAPGAEALQRVYPQLPAVFANELARAADTSELQLLDSGKVPLRLSEELRVYRHQIRLARAYEGLYLSCVPNWDSDRLIVHTLAQLPGWPAETRVRLLQRLSWPAQDYELGPLDGHPYKTITHAEAGYIVHDDSQPGAAISLYPSLYAALYKALPAAMTAMEIADQQALERLVQESPLLPRPALRALLGMQPVRPGYRSPMRLADGRLGYPLSGGGAAAQGVTRQRLLEAVEATGLVTHTGRSADQILLALTGTGRTPLQILEHLQVLLEQRNELLSRLDDWSEAISPATDQAARDYDNLREAILQHWYDVALDESAGHAAELRITRVPLADIPLTLPDFFNTRVRSLSLVDLPSGALAGWAQNERLLQRLLRQMPQIESLEISRAYDPRATPSSFLFSIPTITETLPGLQRLTLTNQNIALSESDLSLLSGLGQLRYLDLSGNRVAQNNSPSFHELSLDYLGLNQMQLSQWPIGIGSDALGRIAHLSLRDNNLRSLPSFLLNEAGTMATPPVISLQGNSINENDLQRLLLNERVDMSGISTDQSAALTEQLTRIRNERQQMRDAIDGWAHASSSRNPLTQEALADRQRIGTAISEFWQQQERGQLYLRLHLEDVAIEHFPRRLPAFFGERVRALSLTRLRGSASQLDELLRRFPNVTRLTIDGHQAATPALASALMRLPQLTFLEFRNMGLEIDQSMLEVFARLEQLTSIDLSGNRVGTINQVPAQLSHNLQSLALTNMNLQAWPSWCDSLLPLELLDLSSNNISQLPEHILSNLNNPMPISSIALFDNPLPLDTILRVRAFSDSQHSYSFALDIPGNLQLVDSSSEGSLDHPHFPLLGDDTPRLEDWMLGNEAQNEALQDCWARLEGSDLLRLVGRLHNAAPYADPKTRTTFCERVRLVLVAAASNEIERATMEQIAVDALPDPVTKVVPTCHDGALQTFNDIELYLMNQHLLIDAGDTLKALHRRLLQLFRINQLEELAKHRTGSGDHVSVRLAYRRELARELDLPLSDRMRFRGAANLAAGELASVLEKVRQSELSDALIDYMLANSDWTTRLRVEHADRFAEIEARFRMRVLELASKDHPLQDELNLQQGLLEDKHQEERELLRELTLAQINSNAGN